MSQKVREPYLKARAVNLILGIMILALFVVILTGDRGTEIFEMIIFALAAAINFISATVCFLEDKKIRGNIYAVIGTIFLVVSLLMSMVYFVFA